MENLDWKTRLLIYLVMKRYSPSEPGWLVAAEQAYRLLSIIQQSEYAPRLSPSVESSLQCILTISKSGLRSSRYLAEHLCSWWTHQSMIKISSIDKDYVGIYKNPENALQAFRQHGQEQEVLCLRKRSEWPTQADSLR